MTVENCAKNLDVDRLERHMKLFTNKNEMIDFKMDMKDVAKK